MKRCIKMCIINGRVFQPGDTVEASPDVLAMHSCFESVAAPPAVAPPARAAPVITPEPPPPAVPAEEEAPLPSKKKKEK